MRARLCVCAVGLCLPHATMTLPVKRISQEPAELVVSSCSEPIPVNDSPLFLQASLLACWTGGKWRQFLPDPSSPWQNTFFHSHSLWLALWAPSNNNWHSDKFFHLLCTRATWTSTPSFSWGLFNDLHSAVVATDTPLLPAAALICQSLRFGETKTKQNRQFDFILFSTWLIFSWWVTAVALLRETVSVLCWFGVVSQRNTLLSERPSFLSVSD